MKCPRCDNSTLDERERDGVTVDHCGQCRGLWLDRGELEKLLHRAQRELEEETAWQRPRDDSSFRERRRDDDDDDDDYRRRSNGYRKKRWFESLTDLFD